MHSIRAKSCLKGFYLVHFPDQLWNFSFFNSFIQSKNGSFLAKQLRTGILHLGETNIMFLFGNYRDTPDIICVFVFHLDFPYPKSMPKLTWPKKRWVCIVQQRTYFSFVFTSLFKTCTKSKWFLAEVEARREREKSVLNK